LNRYEGRLGILERGAGKTSSRLLRGRSVLRQRGRAKSDDEKKGRRRKEDAQVRSLQRGVLGEGYIKNGMEGGKGHIWRRRNAVVIQRIQLL